MLLTDGHITPRAACAVLSELIASGADGFEVAALTQDIVRRGFVSRDVLAGIEGTRDWLGPAHRMLARLPEQPPPAPLTPPVQAPDYISLVRGWDRHG